MNDPYYLVREEIQESVNKLHASYERWDRLPQGSTMRNSVAKDLVGECESVMWQLGELDRATSLAEQDFARFKIDKAELASRRNWNASTRSQVESVKGACAAAVSEQAAKAKGGKGTASKLENAITDENETYLGNAGDQHASLIRRQDEDLEDLSEAVKKLGVVAGSIGEELDSQGKLLDDLEEDVDGVSNRLSAAQRKLKNVIEKTGMKGQLAIIACLVITLVILLVLVVS